MVFWIPLLQIGVGVWALHLKFVASHAITGFFGNGAKKWEYFGVIIVRPPVRLIYDFEFEAPRAPSPGMCWGPDGNASRRSRTPGFCVVLQQGGCGMSGPHGEKLQEPSGILFSQNHIGQTLADLTLVGNMMQGLFMLNK